MGRTAKKRTRARREREAQFVAPTPERVAKGPIRREGVVRRIVPVIETLRDRWLLDERNGVPAAERSGITRAEWEALAYYRDQAGLADKSPVRSAIDFSPRGGPGPGAAILSAQLETWRIERELGELQPLARAIAVDDMSLTQWCIARHGGRERANGGSIAIVPRGADNGRKRIELARIELRFAAWRIAPASKGELYT